MMNHTNCSHPATSAARAACRKALAANAQTDAIRDLIAAFNRVGGSNDWLAYAAVEADHLNPGRIVIRADGSGSSYDPATTVRRAAAPRVDPAPFLAKINYNAR